MLVLIMVFQAGPNLSCSMGWNSSQGVVYLKATKRFQPESRTNERESLTTEVTEVV